MTSPTSQPTTVRLLETPATQALTELAAILEDLQTVLRCCERLVKELANPSDEPDDLLLESMWTTALLSYTRCFHSGRGGMGLTEDDVTATPLQGEVLQWHKVLRQLRKHFADSVANPRERFSVGAVQDSHGHVNGIAVTSTRQPSLDDVTVRQTGALAYELSRLVDQRITEHQQQVLDVANTMSKADLDKLPLIDVTAPESTTPDNEGRQSQTEG